MSSTPSPSQASSQPATATLPNYTITESLHWAFDIRIPNPFGKSWTPTTQEQAIFNESCERTRIYNLNSRSAFIVGFAALYALNFRQFRARPNVIFRGFLWLPMVGLTAQTVPAWQGYRQVRLLPKKESAFNQQGYRFRHFATALFFAQKDQDVELRLDETHVSDRK